MCLSLVISHLSFVICHSSLVIPLISLIPLIPLIPLISQSPFPIPPNFL
ncbi:hypothetical protein FDUTEX481_00390 [Tolypothrix sp. PCC 7601]|nr:hypothetical protein FDUTEX481_00390 [Tolypothrix sp. PCC 7601]